MDFCFNEYGNKVKLWIIFNEFWIVLWLGYGVVSFVLNKYGFGINIYIVIYNLIKFYVVVWYIYNNIYWVI